MAYKRASNRSIILAIILAALIIAMGVGVGLSVGKDCGSDEQSSKPKTDRKSATGDYRYAAVATGAEICSNIGNDILARKRGNAIDAAVASLLCIGVVNAHSAGIGGGSFFTIHHNGRFYSLDSRETAPAAATQDMYAAPQNRIKSRKGGMSAGIPGEVLGLYELHRDLGSGSVSWHAVVMPTVLLCREGVPLSVATHKALKRIDNHTMFAPYFDEDDKPLPAGSKIRLPELAQTFSEIADDPFSFYNGSLADRIVQDLSDEGGIITKDDLASYTVRWATPTKLDLPGGYSVYSTPAPGSGPVLSYILAILAGYKLTPDDMSDVTKTVLTNHRIAEAFKFAFAKRSELGDGHDSGTANMTSLAFGQWTRQQISDSRTQDTGYYHPTFDLVEDHGTAHLSVMDGDGNAVSATSTINHYFGGKVRGHRTGIYFNNEMDDFSTPNTTNYFGLPASPANFISPGKRPLSSMCPAIVYDNNRSKVKLVTGAAGGSKITTATALSIIDVLWLGMSVGESTDRPRLHHQLIPRWLFVDSNFDKEILAGLRAKGHDIKNMFGHSVIQAVDVTDSGLTAVSDFRKGGKPDGF